MVKMVELLKVDWTKRNNYLEQIRKKEIKNFLRFKKYTKNKQLLDLGCGKDKYLHQFFTYKQYKICIPTKNL